MYLKDLAVLLLAVANSACVANDGDGVPTDTNPPAPPASLSAYFASPETICSNPAVILCEDFETDDQSSWSDYRNDGFAVSSNAAVNGTRSMEQEYSLGQVSAGWLGWFFGDHPHGGARAGESFEQIYFRWYHKFQDGWPALYPPKMARVRSHYVDCAWCFAWVEHFWVRQVGTGHSDPVSLIAAPDGTTYSDSERWLGSVSMDLEFADHEGEWVALEMRVQLNTPGQSDGRLTYWADGRLVLDRQNLNLRGAYGATTINVAMIDTYWNDGSPAAGLRRWYDNVVVSTEPVGCAAPTIEKSALSGQVAWEIEVAVDVPARTPVWSSGRIAGTDNEITLSDETGTFASGHSCITPGDALVVRARHQNAGGWSEWTEWLLLWQP
jgi:hypothetical protein